MGPGRETVMRISDIMSQPVVTAGLGSTLDTVARKMWEHNCGSIPVVDEDGLLAGFITDRDICMAAYTQGKPLSAIPVTTAMAKQVSVCHADDPVSEAERVMCERRVRRVPVVNGKGEPVGMVSLEDIARGAAGAKPGKRRAQEAAVVQTMASVGVRRSNDG